MLTVQDYFTYEASLRNRLVRPVVEANVVGDERGFGIDCPACGKKTRHPGLVRGDVVSLVEQQLGLMPVMPLEKGEYVKGPLDIKDGVIYCRACVG